MSELHIEEMPFSEPHLLFGAFAHEPFALLLDSATAATDSAPDIHGHWSFIALDPFDTFTVASLDEENPFDRLKSKLQSLTLPSSLDHLPPFTGGAAGFFSYDLAHYLEKLPPIHKPFAIDDQRLPVLALGFYDAVAAFDMKARRAFVISNGLPESNSHERTIRAKARAAQMRQRLAAAHPVSTTRPKTSALRANLTRREYEGSVERIVDYIRAGDIFQANFTQRFEAELDPTSTPYDLYINLRNISPAPFSSFFNFGKGALVSSSPERFLFCKDGNVETKPIKGTRPRGKTPTEDNDLADELLSSEKDRTENVMIVDLLRNDLSRTCADHSVTVEKLCALESYANVHHLVSTVRGKLRDGMIHLDLLANTFPGGSITGAPKLRAMEIIAELEPTTRGPYCGAIGYLGFDGTMDTSIAIRTMVVKDRRVTFQAGGGITAESVASAEYDESLTKARGMAQALGAHLSETTDDKLAPLDEASI